MKRTSLFVGLLGLLAACSGQKPWFEPRTEATARQQRLETLADHGIVLGIGTVTIPRGSVLARSADGKTRPVRSGDKIDNGETLETTAGSEAVITYDDQSTARSRLLRHRRSAQSEGAVARGQGAWPPVRIEPRHARL